MSETETGIIAASDEAIKWTERGRRGLCIAMGGVGLGAVGGLVSDRPIEGILAVILSLQAGKLVSNICERKAMKAIKKLTRDS